MAESGSPALDTVALAELQRLLSEEASSVSNQRSRTGQFLLREPTEADFGTPQRTAAEQALIRAHGSCAQDAVDFMGNVESALRRVGGLIDHSVRTMNDIDEQHAQAISQAVSELDQGPRRSGGGYV